MFNKSGHLLLLIAVVLLSSCEKQQPKEPVVELKEPIVKLYVFECGVHEFKDISPFSPGVDKGVAKTLGNSCYLIQHQKGNMLWDAGLDDSMGTRGMDLWEGNLHLSVTNPLMKQLGEINVSPEQINFLGISHFHFDHTGNANNFINAKLILQKEEYDAAYGKEPEKYFFRPDSYSKLDKEKAIQLTGDHDVFGDGRVIIKRALGHTPGHQVLYVNLEQDGPVVISGDVVHYTKNWENMRVPSFNFDKEESLKSMKMIAAFIKEKKAMFWIQHDLEQNAGIKHAPAYYQ